MFSLRILTLFLLSWSLSVTAGADTKKHFRVGVEADDIVTKVIFDSISENYDLEFAYITVEQFSDGLRSVDSGHIDFFSNVMYTKDRAELFDFTAPTNIEYVYFFGLEKFNVDSVKRLAVPKGTVFDEVIKQELPRITFLEFTSAEDAIALLHSRQVDGVVAGLSHLKAMKMSGIRAFLLNDLLPIEPVSVIAKKGNYPELLEIIEQHARSGSFQKHLREHIESYQYEVRKQALRREAVSRGIDVRQPLKVKLENVNIFVNYHKNGAVDGITADTLFQACDILQFRCDLVSQASESWSSMYGSLEERSIDILSPMAVTKEREQAFFLSDKYYSPEAILVKRKHYKEDVYFSIAEMVAENMGVVKGNFFESLLTHMLPGKTLYTYSSQEELFRALLAEEVDYILITRAAFHDKLRRSKNILPITEEDNIGSLYKYGIALGFPKTEKGEVLARLFSQAFELMNLGSIAKQYDYPPDWYTTIKAQKEVSRNSSLRFLFIIIMLSTTLYVLYKKSITDELTRLKNRLALYRKYGKAFSKSKTLVYLDVNKFKHINDTYGHRVGDKVLKQLGANILRHWRGGAYRIGGDEFVLVSSEPVARMEQRLEKIREFSYIDSHSDLKFMVTTSAGVVTGLGETLSLDDVLHIADQSMYQSKKKFRQSERS